MLIFPLLMARFLAAIESKVMKKYFQTSTTSTLLATAEPAMTTTVAFAGASFDHEHGDDGDDGQHFGDILLHLISISTKTHLQWDIERKRRRRGNYYMAPPQHCRPPPLGGCSINMIRIEGPHKLYMAACLFNRTAASKDYQRLN